MAIFKILLFFLYSSEYSLNLGILGISLLYNKKTHLRYFFSVSFTKDLVNKVLYFRINLLFLEFRFKIKIG